MVDLSSEVSSEWSGDSRIGKRLSQVATAVGKAPAKSFPKVFQQSDELEAFYRLVRNDRVSFGNILQSHVGRTVGRVMGEEEVLIVHDTTALSFNRENGSEEIGWVSGNQFKATAYGGFLGHFAFAVSCRSKPLGVIGARLIRRHGKPRAKRYRRSDPGKESGRWWEMVHSVRKELGEKEVIHVMDREGDFYELFSQMEKSGERFVVRLCQDRRIESDTEKGRISEVLKSSEVVTTREVELSKRRKDKHGRKTTKSGHSPRKKRVATLSIRAEKMTIKRPFQNASSDSLPRIEVSVVHVFEIDPPEGQEPVDWKLITTESIENEEKILRIVDIYRRRWLIEEYFKALKTGCAFEKRELQSFKTLATTLAILIPVAFRLLLIRHLSRTAKDEKAKSILTEIQLTLLRSESKMDLAEDPTIEQAMLAIAKLGGHIKNNGDPGWIVLGRGYEDLLMMERGYALAIARREATA